ncbi:Uncharacterised protein [Mycobacteroides abscessus subsp. abscessus]|nr:Uncharacterised protein [Mycobacteroides abscessus subsp. abscessus]SKV56392.1 Uncharacterised protein [Mycobacteroides abscessus subsp. abscessus]
MPMRFRMTAYSACTPCPSKDTLPADGWVLPTISRAKVDLPAPEGPMTAVSEPGPAEKLMSSSSFLPPSTTKSMLCTSRPPTRVAVVGLTSVPSWTTRSTLPMVTVSPSRSDDCSTWTPLTKVPLMVCRSWISRPPDVGSNNAW